jgi:hypothetical protein
MGKAPSILFGLSVSHIAKVCGVSLKTAGRWKAGTTCPSLCDLAVLSGDLAAYSVDWAGWCIRGDSLVSPEGWCITVNDVLAAPLLRQQLAVYQAELRSMREVRDSLEEQPEPGTVPAEFVA